MTRPAAVRFDEKFAVSALGGCWEWHAAHDKHGYGYIKIGGRSLRAHRVSYERYVGPIPIGHQVCHKCDNPKCVNPQHLFVGTAADNARDRHRKGRTRTATARGSAHVNAKLTEEQVLDIRRRIVLGESAPEIGRRFGVSKYLVWRIGRRIAWKHLPQEVA